MDNVALTKFKGSSLAMLYAPNIRFAAMLTDGRTIGGKSLMGFGSGGLYSIEHLLLTST
ncbi:MAG TPA: hypothetical protein VKT28_15230 [Puia sp.]|nr:hypothetical protein [Puia sp.]